MKKTGKMNTEISLNTQKLAMEVSLVTLDQSQTFSLNYLMVLL